MSRYWIADLHLGHEKVAKLRGFESTEEHDDTIIDQLMKLRLDDEVWILGDISSGRKEGEEKALKTLREIGFWGVTFHLIAGNHDSVSSIHRNGYKHQREWLEVLDSIQQFGRMKFNGHQILMSHYPYARSGDGTNRDTVRYLEYRLPDTGLPLIHGHTHQPYPHMIVDTFDIDNGTRKQVLDLQQLCVSWDVHRRLFTEKDVLEWTERIPRGGR